MERVGEKVESLDVIHFVREAQGSDVAAEGLRVAGYVDHRVGSPPQNRLHHLAAGPCARRVKDHKVDSGSGERAGPPHPRQHV